MPWPERVVRASAWTVFMLLLVLSIVSVARTTQLDFVLSAHEAAHDLLIRMWPPHWASWGVLMRPLWDTINIATWGTALAIVIGGLLGFLAARNTSPHPMIRACALFVIAATRSINSVIWALIFSRLLGPGVLAGVLAIGMRSIGFIGKLLYEAIEEIDPNPVEALASTGAKGSQIFVYGILPQVQPSWTGISLFRWEINVRESAVVGLVGAGGIGMQLDAAAEALRWDIAAVIMLMILGLVIFAETVAAKVRERIL
ncbi:MAG: phosphonate ABC transporter, permease protein PhnE [Verrucomicrobiales bacterium]